jgi:hypothetical protein
MNSYLDNYILLNTSFKKKFTFRLGCDSGFFSEYNNMVLAILYCLKYGYQFNLSSSDSNISDKGWNDFFLPFCDESTSSFHKFYNFRGHHRQSKKQQLITSLYRLSTGKSLTQDLWHLFHSREFEHTHFNLPELGVNSTLLEAAKRIIEITWRFKPEIDNLISIAIQDTNLLPGRFAGLHIRRGDKISETKNIDYHHYIEAIKKNTSLKDIFLATDDYNVYLHLKDNFPDFNFHTFSKPLNKGFDYATYSNYAVDDKRSHLIDLFKDIEMLSMSGVFVGTFSSNIGMYMGMRKGGKGVIGVDYDKWMIW